MNTATIYFSNGETLTVSEKDFFTPIIKCEQDGKIFASMGSPIELFAHVHNGLIPAILDIFYSCDYFFVCSEQNIVYSSKNVVKVIAN